MNDEKKKTKHLPTYGFIGALVLIIVPLVIFNLNWTALGANPKWDLLPDITKNYEEFKDYSGLLFALLNCVGAFLSSLLILLFYGEWKQQHNASIETDYKKEILRITRKIKPIENKYYRMLGDFQTYKGNPEFALPIKIDMDESSELVDNVNELLGLLEELYIYTDNIVYKEMKDKYFKHANLYPRILAKVHYISTSDSSDFPDKTKSILEVLDQKFEYEYTHSNGNINNFITRYSHCFCGINKLEIIKHVVKELKLK